VHSEFRVFVVAVLLLSIACVAPPGAAAGTYTVRQCDYAVGNGYSDFVWQASGSPAIGRYDGSGCSEFGLAARNGGVGGELRYPSGAYGGWFAYAPIGTAITRFAGAFGTIVGCCVNGLAPYAEASGADGRAYLFQGDLGNGSWYAPSGLQGPQGRSWESSRSGFDAKSVGFYLRCGPGFSCYQNPTGDFRLRGRSFDFTLRDDVAPSVGDAGGTLLAGGWLRGARGLAVPAGDTGGGLTGVSATFDNGTSLHSPTSCTTVAGRYAQLQPCPRGHTGVWTVDTSNLPDGVRSLTMRATDVGGAVADRTHSLKVDNTAPAAPIGAAVQGGGGWRNSNGFTLEWANPGGQHAPIAQALYRACPTDGGQCIDGEQATANVTTTGPIALPHAGEWDVRVWLVDAAGNSDPSLASPAQRLRFDPDPPALRFRGPEPDAPTRVAVETSDRSGLSSGQVEMRPLHAEGWQPLPTTLRAGTLVAAIDDSVKRGVVELRARAVDRAGNGSTLLGGVRTLPLRAATRLDAAIVERVRRIRPGCRRKPASRCHRLVTVRRAAVRSPYGSFVTVRGRLATAGGRPLTGQPVAVSAVSRDRAVHMPDARTDSAGRLTLVLRARRSAAIQLRFAGGAQTLPSSRQVVVRVPAPVTMRARRPLLHGGGRVILRGRVAGGSLPAHGKLVEIQAHFRGRWRTISAVRSAPDGRWRFRYAFQSTPRPAIYRMRARVPAEARYPFAAGSSRPVRVTVLPQ
jgi:hypothetical protein